MTKYSNITNTTFNARQKLTLKRKNNITSSIRTMVYCPIFMEIREVYTIKIMVYRK